MRVASSKTRGVVSYTLYSDRSHLILALKCVLIIAAAWAWKSRAQVSVALGLALAMFALRAEVSESVVAIEGLGLQLEQKGHLRLLSDDSRFFPKHSIRTILINEVFEGFKVNYVLQLVTSDANEMSLIFPHMRPKLDVIKEVWRSIRSD